MSKSTPGPWSFQKFAHSAAELEEIRSHGLTPIRLLTNDGEATIMAGEGDDRRPVGRAICHARFKRGEGYKAECEERDANARLIAAAPELLAALRGALDFINSVPTTRDEAPMMDACRAAISKATATQDRGKV